MFTNVSLGRVVPMWLDSHVNFLGFQGFRVFIGLLRKGIDTFRETNCIAMMVDPYVLAPWLLYCDTVSQLRP
jgi:hypothetical protein